MEKRGIAWGVILVILLIIIVAISIIWFSFKPSGKGQCSEFNLTIKSVECEKNVKGMVINFERGKDSLGIGTLKVYAVDKVNQNQTGEADNINASQQVKLAISEIIPASKTFLVSEFKIIKNDKTLVCPGPRGVYNCAENLNKPVNNSAQIAAQEVPEPSGKINWIDTRDEFGDGYPCISNKSGVHKIRLYTYKKINNTQTLSKNYLESDEVKNICKNYPDETGDFKYNLQWSWTPVQGIDGYKLFQSYKFNNVSRNFSYSVTLTSTASKLVDSGLSLWKINR